MDSPAVPPFAEKHPWSTPLRDLGLKIEGTPLEPVIAEFLREVEAAGLRRLRPHVYLTTQWVVPDDTVAIGVPFYLARRDLTELHAEKDGHLEGVGRAAFLRYLRHEMGHVVNYAYRLYDREEWVALFGSMTQPYEEEYRPEPFSRRYVVHLPGWYAQKHPDEDWAETFAVWMTPGVDWRRAYADWPVARAKLEYCDRLMREVGDREPDVTAVDPDWDVGGWDDTPEDVYASWAAPEEELRLPGLDGALVAVFEDEGEAGDAERLPASGLLRKWESRIMADVFRWTGHFPERTKVLLRHMAARADELKQVYAADAEARALLGVSTLVTALAMNHVHRGEYVSGDAPG